MAATSPPDETLPSAAPSRFWIFWIAVLVVLAVTAIVDPQRFNPLHFYLGLGASIVAMVLLVRSLVLGWRSTAKLLAETNRELRASEAYLRAIFDSVPESLGITGLDGRVLEINPAGLALMQATDREQLLGHDAAEFVHPDDRARLAQVSMALGGGDHPPLRYRIVGLAGRVRWVEWKGTALAGTGAPGGGYLGVTRDVTDRVEAERRLQETTLRLETVFRAVPDLFFFLKIDGTILDFRGGATAELDLPPEQFLGRRFADVLPPGVSGSLVAAVARMQRSGEPVTIEYQLTTPAGERVFEARILPAGSEQAVMVARNVTERRRAENARAASEAQYRRIVETAAEGIWTLDLQGLTTFANPRMAELLGYAPEELIGRSVFDFLADDGRELVRQFLARGASAGRRAYELAFTRRDGSVLWATVSGNPIPDADGRFIGGLGMITDITAARAAQAQLRETQRLMTNIVEHSPNLIFVKDAQDLRFVVFNRACEQTLGFRRDEVIDKSDHDLFAKEAADCFNAADRGALARRGGLTIPRERVQTRAGGTRYLRTAKVPILDPQGRPEYLLGISEDITDRIRMEDALRQAQKLEAVGTLAGSIAHDFNNILASVMGFSELARIDSADNPRVVRLLDRVLIAGERAKHVVDELMAFSRQTEPELQPLAPAVAIGSAVDLVRGALPANVSLAVTIGDDLPPILGDVTQLHRIVSNLVLNAADAMGGRGGEMTLGLDRVGLTDAEAAPDRELFAGDYVRLTLTDTGCGMDQATLGRIFEPFFTNRQSGGGTGLGLAIVHDIVKGHGGAILVASTPGVGTRFEVYLPVDHGAVPAVSSSLSIPPTGRGEHILVVDDEAGIVEATCGLLESLGYQATGLTDPARAVRVVRELPAAFALVITDLAMPAMSGTELAQELLRLRPDLPILLSTGFAGQDTPEAARALGLSGVLSKPTSVTELANAVRRAIGPIA